MIRDQLCSSQSVDIKSLLWETDNEELRHEQLMSFTGARLQAHGTEESWRSLLTNWEWENLHEYERQWREKYGEEDDLADAVWHLGNTAHTTFRTMSTRHDGRPATMPTLLLDCTTIYMYVCVIVYHYILSFLFI